MGNLKFHLFFLTMLSLTGLLAHKLVQSFAQDFARARPDIERESFDIKNKLRLRLSSFQNQDQIDYFNKAIRLQASRTDTPAVIPPEEEQLNENLAYENQEYWCRKTEVSLFTDSNRVQCEYLHACYRCSNSRPIIPEIDTAVPFCEDGNKAVTFDVECCPTDIHGETFECPPLAACLHSKEDPKKGCACSARSDCNWKSIQGEIQCMCSED